MESIVCLAAHPDDLAFCMGGTLLLLKDHCRIHVLCATKGERGLDGQGLDETAAIREKEEQAACDILGAELTFLGRIDREVFADEPTCRLVAKAVDRIAPSALFALWSIDSHPDHAAVSEIARKAVFLARTPPPLVYYEAAIGTQTTQFRPDVYVDITAVMDRKNELIRCHACQNPDDALVQWNLAQFRHRGAEAGCEYAEGFKLTRPIKMTPDALLAHLA
ncbi:hypothetical protein LCGC14_1275580 [marine sediment metagenome]|uniref:Uncharacterized protein n=1 Tax=marine sediment metagenome TaxID=412755 RepID=A0A0F9NDI1_9ZZZZ